MNVSRSDRVNDPIRILLIEDSSDIQEATCLIFSLHWPEARVIQAFKGAEGMALMRLQSPDLVILDLGLPDMDGMRVLKDIRSYSDVPVIILTVRGEEMDKVRGLELGADDFIVKPFTHKELLARMRTIMQRRKATGGQDSSQVVAMAGRRIEINDLTNTVTKGERPVRLTNTELNLLKYFAEQDGRVLTEEEILTKIWGSDYVDCTEYLEAYIRRLREKIEDDPHRPTVLVRAGNGYRFVQNAS